MVVCRRPHLFTMSDYPPPAPIPAWRKFGRVDAHHRFFISLAVAAAAFALMPHHLTWATRLLGTWNAFIYTTLGLIWTLILSADPQEVVASAKTQDTSRTAIFVLVVMGALVSVFAVIYELTVVKSLHGSAGAHVAFCVATILSSWVLVHTTFTLRYAHSYYGTDDGKKQPGGLAFADECEPDYLDFAYFSFTIGMCSQNSDVAVNSSDLRRLCLVHSVISFLFNVAIVGFSINAMSGLLQ